MTRTIGTTSLTTGAPTAALGVPAAHAAAGRPSRTDPRVPVESGGGLAVPAVTPEGTTRPGTVSGGACAGGRTAGTTPAAAARSTATGTGGSAPVLPTGS